MVSSEKQNKANNDEISKLNTNLNQTIHELNNTKGKAQKFKFESE
jgi:hypothetical protein